MKSSPRSIRAAVVIVAVAFSIIPQHGARAAVTLNSKDDFVPSGDGCGDLMISGMLSVAAGIDFGTTATVPAFSAVQLTYQADPEHALRFDLTEPAGQFEWRDHALATPETKMTLDGLNVLTLYRSDGTGVGIQLEPNSGRIELGGTGSGIYVDGMPVLSLATGGNSICGGKPLELTSALAATSSETGALTVAGGIGIGKDSFVSGLRVGRGSGGIATNTAFGLNALSFNTSGSSNTAVGYQALWVNRSGSNNTSIGAGALANNTLGQANTTAGAYALSCNSSGSSNTATGYSALRLNTTGSTNTAVGDNALVSNNTGSRNLAVGSYGLKYNSSGCDNTATGFGALQNMTSGSSNLALGSNAGSLQANGAALALSNKSIYLGAAARGFSNSDTNSIVIGCEAVGEGANTTVIGNASTVKTHLYGTVNASGLTVNNVPALTAAYGPNSSVANGATLAVGNNAHATDSNSVAIGFFAEALGASSMALGDYSQCTAAATGSIAMSAGYATGAYAWAATSGQAAGEVSMAFGTGYASGVCSIALGGYDWEYQIVPGNQSTGDNSATVGGVGNQAVGFASFASGFWTKAMTHCSVALGSLNEGLGASADSWVETDPLFELGNGDAPRSDVEPDATTRSNAITTLKNGQTTLTNKAWKANAGAALADPESAEDSGGEALVVEGHTRLRGKVIIEQAQGDISMGIYGP